MTLIRSKMEASPQPRRGKQLILDNEFRGEWHTPPNFILETDAQFRVVGQLYWWQYCGGGNGRTATLRMLNTHAKVLDPLTQRGLIKVANAYHIKLTPMGKRAYEASYWLREHEAERARERVRERHIARFPEGRLATAQGKVVVNSDGYVDPYQLVRKNPE